MLTNKGTQHNMAHKEISFASRDSEFTTVEEEQVLTEIEISINSIENIVRDGNLQIKFKVEHQNVVLGESDVIKIDANNDEFEDGHLINLAVGIPYTALDPRSIRSLVSSPVLITAYEVIEEELPPKKNGKKKNKVKVDPNPRQSLQIELKTLGMCNIDLLPLVLGEISFDEKLALEIPSYTWDSDGVAWENLPRIWVSVSQDDTDIMMKGIDFNVMSITVESIYNLPSCFVENMDYKCGTVTFTSNAEDSCIAFEGGKWTDYHDVERTKTWKSLYNLDSRARFSKCKIDCDYECVKNEFHKQFDLKKVAKQDEPRIEWNVVDRVLLEKNEVKNVQEQIIKYKNWPFELMINEKDGDQLADGITYQFYVDASQLLFPGRNKTRVLAQLFTQSSFDMEEKTGWKYGIFNSVSDDIENRRDSFVQESFSSEESEWKEKESVPLFTETGEPVLILIEFELQKPLYAARTLDEYRLAIDAMKKTTRHKAPFYYYTPDIVHDQYMSCIRHLVNVIAESYRDFTDRCECQDTESQTKSDDPCKMMSSSRSSDQEGVTCPYVYIPDELSQFKQFLHEKGKYVSIRSTLKNKIENLLDQKFAIDSPAWYNIDNQNLIASCYTYLIEQMHVALNSKLDSRCAEEPDDPENFRDLWIRAEEACEYEDYDKADKLYVKIICDNRNNPDAWLVYATFLVRRYNVDEAVECCREAIKLDSRHKIALLFYGIILASKEQYTDAETFLTAVTQLHPRFAEGWAILHLFYIKIQYYPGIDLTLCIAEECLRDRARDCETMKILNEEPIAWSTALCKNDRVFLLTTCLLLKLNLYNCAAAALAQDFCHHDKTIAFLYFSSVNRYLQQSYSMVIECLEEAESLIGLEFSVAALFGHAHYKSGNMILAMSHYESVDMLYDRPENIHAVHLRLGFYLIEIEEYERARNVFLRACKHSRTCKTWLGVGICSYFLERFEECETALTEANRIDCEDPEVWGYLCLMSMALKRYEEFTQCYRQMVKNSLSCEKLWRFIKETMDTLGYPSPVIVPEETNEMCIC